MARVVRQGGRRHRTYVGHVRVGVGWTASRRSPRSSFATVDGEQISAMLDGGTGVSGLLLSPAGVLGPGLARRGTTPSSQSWQAEAWPRNPSGQGQGRARRFVLALTIGARPD